MKCVECGSPVPNTYKLFSPGNIRLTRCNQCHQLADRYVEFEFILVALDLILHKTQVYRHLLYNCLPTTRWWTLLNAQLAISHVFLDAYVAWLYARIHEEMIEVELITPRYGTLLLRTAMEYGIFFLGALVSARVLGLPKDRFCTLINALLVSGSSRFINILMMVWDYGAIYAPMTRVFTLTSNLVAVYVVFEGKPLRAILVVACAFLLQTHVWRHLLT